jgi:hypothetical protein
LKIRKSRNLEINANAADAEEGRANSFEIGGML